MTLEDFNEIVICDFEYHHAGAEEGPPIPVCCCVRELRSGRTFRLWHTELSRLKRPPYAHGSHDLLIAYNAVAELSCYAVLHWPMPRNVLDLLIEYRQHANGVIDKNVKRDLLHALRHFKLSGIEAAEKESWRDLILTGGPFDAEQRAGILSYCWSDIVAEEQLFDAMRSGGCQCRNQAGLPRDLERVLYRGRYTLSVAATQVRGVPIDTETWNRLLEHRTLIRDSVIAEAAAECPVYEDSVFRIELFNQWLEGLGLLRKWPRTAKGTRLATDDETFRIFSWHPKVERLRQVRQLVQTLRKPSFTVTGERNFFGILPFKAESSRNATAGCIFQAPAWTRGLIMPRPGTGLVYADYASQEFYAGAVLSGDKAMQAVYMNGDPYLHLASMAGLIPRDGTKAEYPAERKAAKTAMLAIMYGQKAPSLALRLGVSLHCAEDLIAAHKRSYRQYWAWVNQAVSTARWNGEIKTVCGWRLAVDGRTKNNTLLNFPLQSFGAEVLRLASILMWERDINVIAPVHDGILSECAESDLERTAEEMQCLMAQATEHLTGVRFRTDVRVLRHPNQLLEDRGLEMWERIQAIQNRLNQAA